MRRTNLLALFLAVILAFSLAWPSFAAESPTTGIETIEEILNHVNAQHISRPNTDTLVQGAIEGLIDKLKDPYTEYLPPEQLKDFHGALDGEYVGVGVQLQPGEIYPKIIEVMEDSPAKKASLMSGDLITKVDESDVSREPVGKVVQKIRGPEGTKVRLTIHREGAADFEVELLRSNINRSTVIRNVLDDDTGYIKIETFGVHTAGDFKKDLDGLIRQGMEKLVLDLRDNPGGILQSAVQITSNFIDPGKVVVSTVDRNSKREEYRTEGVPAGKGMTILALVNHNSASASEILAGALQDYGTATLVGTQTYGKGTVQTLAPLKSGGALKITIARYHTPKGRVIDGKGLTPDIQVLTPGLSLAVAQGILKKAEKTTVVFEVGAPSVTVNGVDLDLKQMAIQRQDGVYLPLRFVFEALGYRVDWQTVGGSIKVTGHDLQVVFYPGEGRVTSGGNDLPGAAPLLTEEGSVYIPATDLGLFNINVKIDGGNISIEK